MAVDLRGHGYKTGSYNKARLKNYIADVETIINEYETKPILVGHSLGCSIIRHIAAKDTYPATILIAPIPPAAIFRKIFIKLILKHPVLSLKSFLTLNMRPWITSRISPRLFFSAILSRERAHKYLQQMQGESFNLFLYDLLRDKTLTSRAAATLVVAAEVDSFFNLKAQKRTAQLLEADFMTAAQVGHDVMLDVDNTRIASEIQAWIKQLR